MSAVADWRAVVRIVEPTVRDARALIADGARVVARDRFEVTGGSKASFSGYLASFPVGYWRRHTDIERVRLTLTVTGAAALTVLRSDAAGRVVWRDDHDVVDGPLAIDIPLVGAATDGGWLWFEVTARAGADILVAEPVWSAPAPADTASATVCITTLDRQDDCLGVLRALAADPEVLARIDRVLVVDQGARRLRDADGFHAVAETLGDVLGVIEQPNLGGSGGFSRGMLEAAAGPSTHALLLDDDVALEPEAILRLLAFAEHARARSIVGAQMMSLVEPTVLHSFGEVVERRRFWWQAVDPNLSELDLALHPLSDTPGLHRRIDVDFNGWWMCLIPTSLIRDIGAALPFFIKWDDLEYSLRAADHGTPTITLPAAVVWHMPWTAKDDGLDWQAYFQLRNRLVTALLHSRRRPARLLIDTFAQDVNHVLCLQYGAAMLRRLALRDVLRGPAHLPPTLRRRITDSRALLRTVGQERVAGVELSQAGPAPALGGLLGGLQSLAAVAFHQMRRPAMDAQGVRYTRDTGRWWVIGRRDVGFLESATGSGGFRLRRDRGVALRTVLLAFTLRIQLAVRWGSLARRYRADADRLAGLTTWRTLFETDQP